MDHSIISSASNTAGRMFDASKINQLFDKIESSNNLEIEERSIKNLAQKLQLKLIEPICLAVNHGQQLGALLKWINRRQAEASPSCIANSLSVFQAVSSVQEGKHVLIELGADLFFNEFHKNATTDQVRAKIDQIMISIVNEDSQEARTFTAVGITQKNNPFATQMLHSQTIGQNRANQIQNSIMDQVPLRDQDPLSASIHDLQTQSFASPNVGQPRRQSSQGIRTNIFNRTEFSVSKASVHQDTTRLGNQMEMSFQSRQGGLSGHLNQASLHQTSVHQAVGSQQSFTQQQRSAHQISQHTSVSVAPSTGNSVNPLHTTHMELLHKQQILKEPCELPFVWLTEDDEKKLFDLSVQLKFGDFRTVMIAIHTLLDTVIQDFPIEVLLQRSDIFKSLLDLLEGGQGAVQGHSTNEAYTNLAQQALISFVRRLKNTYRFLANNTNKPSCIQSGRYTAGFQQPSTTDQQARAEVNNLEYLKMSYPGLKEGIWNTQEAQTDLKRYGAQMPNDRLAAASTQGSLSCRAALGLVLTKAIYLLKDTEKIGLYTQLIKESLSTLQQVFRVEGNSEFTELIHLCLFAFDSVCEFYRDQIFEEVLIESVMELMVSFIKLINSIPKCAAKGKERFKEPFSETLFKNTERLQMTLRRALFTSLLKGQETEQIILNFFTRMESDLPEVNLLQKNVTQSYAKAQKCFSHFQTVHNYRIKGGSQAGEDITFVDSFPQLVQSIELLEHLSNCIEMKINFPFEHILLDCMVYANLVAMQNSSDNLIEKIESLVITYLSCPYPEVRERILRRLYQRLRVIQSFQQNQTPHQANNNYLLAKFVYRKKIVNQLVNGMLINQEVANEESKLHMTIGQLLIKCMIVAYNEGGSTSIKQNGLNQFLLTFQSLMPQYPELIGLIDLIEANVDRNCRFLRILRDIFSQDPSKREFSTSVLSQSMSREYQAQRDLLVSVVNLQQPMLDISQDLDLVNLNYDFTNFDIINITSILQNVRTDFGIRKSSLEQLILLLFDCEQKRGKALFINSGVQDVFTFILGEVLTAYKSVKTYLNECLDSLPEGQQGYLDQCLRFIFFAYIFYQDEPVVRATFDKIRSFSMPRKETADAKVEEFETLLNAMVFFCGSPILRKNAIRIIYLQVFHPLWLKVKITKQQATQWRTKRVVSVLVPDFCPDTFVMMIPYQQQVVKMPMRSDLCLSEEQKHFITAMFNAEEKQSEHRSVLSQVATKFVTSKSSGGARDADFNKVMQSFQTLQNYILAISDAREELFSSDVLHTIQELMRILPTRDFEFNFLADFLMSMNQILTVASNLRGTKQLELLVATLCEALKFHLLPYLFEVNLSGLEECLSEKHSARIFFLHEFIEFLQELSQLDLHLRNIHRVTSRFQERVLTSNLVSYLSSLHQFMKDKPDVRKKILNFFSTILQSYDTSGLVLVDMPDLLVSQVSSHRLSLSFEGHSQLIISLRSLMLVYQRRLTHVDLADGSDRFGHRQGDLTHAKSLSATTTKYLEQFTTSGWLVRFTENRDARIRVMAWDLLTEIFDYNFLKRNPSLAQQSINTLLRDGELYCVKISALKFLNKLCDSLIHNCEATQDINEDMHDHVEDRRFVGSDLEHITVKTLLHLCNRQGLISQIHGILNKKDCPIVIISLTLRLLSRLIQMDFRRSLPVLTQLDYWTILVDLIDVQSLKSQDLTEERTMLKYLREQQLKEQPYLFDQVYMTINSIIEFIFEAFKRDSQLAGLLVKTTKLVPSLFSLLTFTLDNVASFHESSMETNKNLPIRNKGLLTIFVDKMVKILHICLLHPREYSVDLIAKFLTQTPPEEATCGAQTATRNWLYVLKLFRLVGSQHSNYFYGHIDVKLAICRFVAELLIRMPQSNFKQHYLDETVRQFDGDKYIQLGYVNDQQDIDTFGGLLLIEFGRVFRSLYVDMQDSRQQIGVPRDLQDHENSKIDICLCLNILIATSDSAKIQSIEQNLLKRIIEICSENVSALHLSELQRFSQKEQKNSHSQQAGKVSKQIFEAQFNRKYKYAQVQDLQLCEREVLRTLATIRHTMYKSGFLLVDSMYATQASSAVIDQSQAHTKSFVSQNAQVHITAKSKKKSESICEKLILLFSSILEQLGANPNFAKIFEECLKTMITMASQNLRFKNSFIAQMPALLHQSKKGNVLKIVTERLMSQNHQANTQEMRLLFALFRTLAMSAEVTKELMKQRTIEDLHAQLQPICKNEKDIKLLKNYLLNYVGFLAAFASTDEGQKAILKCKPVFEMSLFIMDTVTPPSSASDQPEVTPLSQLLTNILLFLRNTSFNRTNKLHFLSDQAFLPCLLAFISSRQQHPRVRAYSAACLWSVLYNHQGVKAAINTDDVRGELTLLQSEFQRSTDIATYAQYISSRADGPETDGTTMMSRTREQEAAHNKRMAQFTHLALSGILNLLEA